LIALDSVRTWIQEGVKIDNLRADPTTSLLEKHSSSPRANGHFRPTRVGEKVMVPARSGSLAIYNRGQHDYRAQSGISKDLPGRRMFGSPAVPLPEAKRQIA